MSSGRFGALVAMATAGRMQTSSRLARDFDSAASAAAAAMGENSASEKESNGTVELQYTEERLGGRTNRRSIAKAALRMSDDSETAVDSSYRGQVLLLLLVLQVLFWRRRG